ncbi:MAG: hypothetical protein R3D63_02385 [Paracoccaceae bacterium]
MSGIAEVLDHATTGSRARTPGHRRSPERLVKLGALFEGQSDNIGEAAVVVISSAIKKGNPEAGRGPPAQAARGAPGRDDAGRADAVAVEHRHCRNVRQDHDHDHGGDVAGQAAGLTPP